MRARDRRGRLSDERRGDDADHQECAECGVQLRRLDVDHRDGALLPLAPELARTDDAHEERQREHGEHGVGRDDADDDADRERHVRADDERDVRPVRHAPSEARGERGRADDARVIGTATFAARFGRRVSYWTYVALVVGAYMALAVGVVVGVVPAYAVLAVLSLPLLVRVIRASELGSQGQQRAIAMIDIQPAQLHAAFGALLVLGILAAALAR